MAGKRGRFDRAAYWPSMIVPIKRGILSIDPGAGKYPIPSIRFPPIVVSLHNLHVSADLSRATDKTAFGEKKQTCKPLKVLGWLAAAPRALTSLDDLQPCGTGDFRRSNQK
jgi:hypothetical protein